MKIKAAVMGGFRAASVRIRQRNRPQLSLLFLLASVSLPPRPAGRQGTATHSVFSLFSTEQLPQSRSFLLPIFSTPWPVVQAMARQMLLATLQILSTSGQEAFLQNKAPTEAPPLQIPVRSP